MRFGILSDIHGNIEALEASFGQLQNEGCDRFISLGDVVGYGPSPRECIDFVRENNIISVKGNHDAFTADDIPPEEWQLQDYAATAIHWTRQELESDQLKWLHSLPYLYNDNGAQFVHASMETLDGEYWPYIMDQKTAQFHFYLQESQVAFFGHIHIPLLFTRNSQGAIKMEIFKGINVKQHPECKLLINPGSIGQPRDSNARSSAVIYDSETGDIELFRIDYDIRKTQEKIIKAQLPQVLADRLSRGR